MSNAFMVGDSVRVILDQNDPDQQFHDRRGEVIDIAFDNASNLYVVEWIVGDWITKLERV